MTQAILDAGELIEAGIATADEGWFLTYKLVAMVQHL